MGVLMKYKVCSFIKFSFTNTFADEPIVPTQVSETIDSCVLILSSIRHIFHNGRKIQHRKPFQPFAWL